MDYVLKDRLGHFGTVVKRAFGEAVERNRRKQAKEDLRKTQE